MLCTLEALQDIELRMTVCLRCMLELRNLVLYKMLPRLSRRDIQESFGVLPVITVYVLVSSQTCY